jgi:hypothetical protein
MPTLDFGPWNLDFGWLSTLISPFQHVLSSLLQSKNQKSLLHTATSFLSTLRCYLITTSEILNRILVCCASNVLSKNCPPAFCDELASHSHVTVHLDL